MTEADPVRVELCAVGDRAVGSGRAAAIVVVGGGRSWTDLTESFDAVLVLFDRTRGSVARSARPAKTVRNAVVVPDLVVHCCKY